MSQELAVAPRREERLFGQPNQDITAEKRSEFERDVDRVTYDYYFRRLAGITQVSSDHGKILHHNRMTHSLKVAQVGRRLVQYLEYGSKNAPGIKAAGGIDRNVVTAAGLLHDFGHPPFGHIGEFQLNELAAKRHLPDGFEGNAQTLRIVLSLASHQRVVDDIEGLPGFEYGLDLTRAVLAACVKYPWKKDEAPAGKSANKWGCYTPEVKTFEDFIVPILPAAGTATLEADIMDWADDITYAVHDLQDFYIDGAIPLHHLRHSATEPDKPVHYTEFTDFWQYVAEKRWPGNSRRSNEVRRVFARYARRFPDSYYMGTREQTASIGALASKIITAASKATSVDEDGHLQVERDTRALIDALKEVTWYYVIDHPDLAITQVGQRAQVELVFWKFYKWVIAAFGKEGGEGQQARPLTTRRRLPERLKAFTEQLLEANNGRGAYHSTPILRADNTLETDPKRMADQRRDFCFARAVLDHIASMTENEFIQVARGLAGTN